MVDCFVVDLRISVQNWVGLVATEHLMQERSRHFPWQMKTGLLRRVNGVNTRVCLMRLTDFAILHPTACSCNGSVLVLGEHVALGL